MSGTSINVDINILLTMYLLKYQHYDDSYSEPYVKDTEVFCQHRGYECGIY